MTEPVTCQHCGASIPGNAPPGFCPKCLFAEGLTTVGNSRDEPATMNEPTEEAGELSSSIGSYKLLEKIGEGGMGEVYMAEQEEPIRRKVALKIIKLGMDTKQVVARFEAERQALALMDHPHIAHIFDGGATESGRPYFVMELVKGISITEYCDGNKLKVRERLELFHQVCQAIQHAHQKGLIHRDIKPSNVLVTLHDGIPFPKVIDFGVAKATQKSLTEKTMFTCFGMMVGTPEYISPEQAEMSNLDVDTRSDVYSLGVLLYELLTGTTPFGGKHLRSAALNEVCRIILEEEPAKPSTKISDLGKELKTVADRRSTVPKRLGRVVRGELDWVVMKTLQKDRTHRYETVSSLDADIQHFLSGEPVEAGPPTAFYRLSKFVRRHKKAIAAAAILLVALVGGLAGALVALWNYRLAQDAVFSRDEAMQATRRSLYFAHMNLVAQAWHDDNVQSAINILDRYAPGGGEEVLRDFAWYYWRHQCSEFSMRIDAHLGGVYAMALFPDGTTLASGGNDEMVKLWDTRNGTLIREFRGHRDRVNSVVVSPNGQILASGGRDQVIRLWDPLNGELLANLTGHGSTLWSLSFSRDGSTLVSGAGGGELFVWDLKTGQRTRILEGHSGNVLSVAISPNGDRIASSSPNTIKIWDAKTGDLLHTLTGQRYYIWHVVFSPDGKTLASAAQDWTVRLWDVATGEQRAVIRGHRKTARYVAFSPDGNTLATSSSDMTVMIWDISKHNTVQYVEPVKVLKGHSMRVYSLAFAPDGETLFSGSMDGTIKSWDIRKVTAPKRLKGYRGDVWSLTFSPDGSMLATGGEDGTLLLWNPNTGSIIRRLVGHSRRIDALAFAACGKLLASGSQDGTIRLWDLDTGSTRATLKGFSGGLAFCPGQENMLAAGTDGALKIWDIEQEEVVKSIGPQADRISTFAFSLDGSRLATAGRNRTIRIWDWPSLGNALTLREPTGEIRSLAFSSDGKSLASSCVGGIKIWDVVTGKVKTSMSGEGELSFCARDGDRTLASAGGGVLPLVMLWDTKTGELITSLRGHSYFINAVEFSPNGEMLASGGGDTPNHLMIWRAPR